MSEKEFKEYGFTKARVRAKGTRGPTRHKLTSFKHITKVPKQVMSEYQIVMIYVTHLMLWVDIDKFYYNVVLKRVSM